MICKEMNSRKAIRNVLWVCGFFKNRMSETLVHTVYLIMVAFPRSGYLPVSLWQVARFLAMGFRNLQTFIYTEDLGSGQCYESLTACCEGSEPWKWIMNFRSHPARSAVGQKVSRFITGAFAWREGLTYRSKRRSGTCLQRDWVRGQRED